MPEQLEPIENEPDLDFAERYAAMLLASNYAWGADAETALVVAFGEVHKLRSQLEAVAALLTKWRDASFGPDATKGAALRACADELERTLQQVPAV